MTGFIVLVAVAVAVALAAVIARHGDAAEVNAEIARDYRIQREIDAARDRQEWAA